MKASSHLSLLDALLVRVQVVDRAQVVDFFALRALGGDFRRNRNLIVNVLQALLARNVLSRESVEAKVLLGKRVDSNVARCDLHGWRVQIQHRALLARNVVGIGKTAGALAVQLVDFVNGLVERDGFGLPEAWTEWWN